MRRRNLSGKEDKDEVQRYKASKRRQVVETV